MIKVKCGFKFILKLYLIKQKSKNDKRVLFVTVAISATKTYMQNRIRMSNVLTLLFNYILSIVIIALWYASSGLIEGGKFVSFIEKKESCIRVSCVLCFWNVEKN